MHAGLCGRTDTGGDALMSSRGSDDRKDAGRRGRQNPPTPAPTDERAGEARGPRPSGPPPGMREDPPRESSEEPSVAEPGYGQPPQPEGRQPWPSEQHPPSPPPAPRYDRFGWPVPEGMDGEGNAERPGMPGARSDRPSAPPQDVGQRPPPSSNPYDTSSWRIPPAPGAPPRAPYSGQFPVQGPGPDQAPRGPYSGQFPTQSPPPPQSGALPAVPDDERTYRDSSPFPAAPPAQDRRSGAFPVPPDAGAYDPARSGPLPQGPYTSGSMPRVAGPAGAMRQSGAFAYPDEVTGTGSRRAVVPPDAGFGSLLTDRPALAFLLVAVAFAGAMIVYIALRYSHFPDQIALHFGPAGASQPTRIGEKRELWTIPFIVGIVLAADTALAWAVYRFDRFAARLLTLGSALVAAIAWVVLLTVLHR